MNTTQAQHKVLDDALVAPADRQVFEDLPLEQDILSFIRDLGHTRDITYLTDVNVDYWHQAWRAFATVINKCLSGKETRMDKIRLSRAQILQDAKKTNKMSYPRFTKIIIDYFMLKDPSISRRNKMFWYTARDDTLFTSMRCISKHEDTQKALKLKYIQKKADSDMSPKKKHVQATTKGTRLKSKGKWAKLDKKKQPAKMTKAKGNGVDTQSKVPDEQQQKTTSTDEGTDSDDKDNDDDDGDNDDDDGNSDDHDDNKEFDNEFYEEEEDFHTVFKFDQRVFAIESELSELKQTNQFAEAVSSISSIFDSYIASKMKEVVDVDVQLQTNKLREEAQAENQEFLNQVDSTKKKIIKDQVKAQVSKIMPKIEKYVTEYLGAEVLVRSTNQPQTAYAVATLLSEFELKKILIDKMEANKSINRSDNQKNLYNALVESYNSNKDIMSSYGDVVLLKRGRDDQAPPLDQTEGQKEGNLVIKQLMAWSGMDLKMAKTCYHSHCITMSSPNHSTSDIEDAFSSMNILNYTSVSSDHFPASSGSISFNSSENSNIIPSVISHFYNNPCLKDVQAFYAKELPIPSPDPITPPAILTPSPIIMVNVIPPDHVDDVPVVELNQHDDVPEVNVILSESSTAPFLHEDSNGLLPGLMRRDINSLFGQMAYVLRRLCGRETAHALVKKKGKAKDKIMPPKSAPMTQAAIRRLIKENVDAAIAAERARHANVRNDARGSGPARDVEAECLGLVMKQLMIAEFYPIEEVQRMEHEL
ncbi:hypothetical protein Tco_1385879 [Tanacetum coccineum]